MKPLLAVMAAAAVLLAACERPSQPRTSPSPASSPASSPTSSGAGPSTATTPAPQTASPTMSEKKEGSNPVQGQVDPKASEQHKDFQQQGDKAGPTSPETQPKQ